MPTYLMEDPREAKRLADKVDPEAWVNRYLRANVEPRAKVLDVGCGPAVLLAALIRQVPDCEVVGVDVSPQRIAEAVKNMAPFPRARAELADAADLPFEDGSFDVVYSRLLMQYLPNKMVAVREFVRVLKPGGLLLLQDLDGQLVWHYPEDEALRSLLNAALAGLAETGFDPFVGRKLYHLAFHTQLEAIHVNVEPYHLFPGRVDEQNERLWELKLDIALPALTKALGSPAEANRVKSCFLDYLRRDDSLTYSTVFTVTGRKMEAKPFASVGRPLLVNGSAHG